MKPKGINRKKAAYLKNIDYVDLSPLKFNNTGFTVKILSHIFNDHDGSSLESNN